MRSSGKVGVAVALRLLQLGYSVLAHSSDPERPSRMAGWGWLMLSL